MAIFVESKFQNDSYVSKLSPSGKTLFLYLLTSPFSTLAGIFEISLEQIASDTRIKYEEVKRLIKKFRRDKKVYYYKGHIIIPEFTSFFRRYNPSQAKSALSIALRKERLLARSGAFRRVLHHMYTMVDRFLKKQKSKAAKKEKTVTSKKEKSCSKIIKACEKKTIKTYKKIKGLLFKRSPNNNPSNSIPSFGNKNIKDIEDKTMPKDIREQNLRICEKFAQTFSVNMQKLIPLARKFSNFYEVADMIIYMSSVGKNIKDPIAFLHYGLKNGLTQPSGYEPLEVRDENYKNREKVEQDQEERDKKLYEMAKQKLESLSPGERQAIEKEARKNPLALSEYLIEQILITLVIDKYILA